MAPMLHSLFSSQRVLQLLHPRAERRRQNRPARRKRPRVRTAGSIMREIRAEALSHRDSRSQHHQRHTSVWNPVNKPQTLSVNESGNCDTKLKPSPAPQTHLPSNSSQCRSPTASVATGSPKLHNTINVCGRCTSDAVEKCRTKLTVDCRTYARFDKRRQNQRILLNEVEEKMRLI
jgi:hypothetical protein